MNSSDVINGGFEAFASVMILLNCVKTYQDKKVRGISLCSIVFFTIWGLWNVYFYPANGLKWSFIAGIAVVIVNIIWVAMLIYYIRKEKNGQG